MSNKLNTVDLFAGCGGLTEGFLEEGHYDTLAAVEWENAPCITLANRLKNKWHHNNASDIVIRFDIQRTGELINGFNDLDFGHHIGLDKLINGRTIDVIIGGPPCQAYSLAGRIRDENGMKNDYRNYLFESYIKIVNHFKPKFFIFENVIGLLSAAPDGTPITAKIYNAFQEAGYAVTTNFRKALFDTADFGIPQHRKRVIILGISKKHYTDKCEMMLESFYSSIMPSLKKHTTTVKEAIGDFPPLSLY